MYSKENIDEAMKKNVYVKPMLRVVELDTKVLMQPASPGASGPGIQVGGGDGGGDVEAESQGRRGSWGNLWD